MATIDSITQVTSRIIFRLSIANRSGTVPTINIMISTPAITNTENEYMTSTPENEYIFESNNKLINNPLKFLDADYILFELC